MTLPPGQRVVLDPLPRFGTHLWRPPPTVPADPVVTVRGIGLDVPVVVAVRDLAAGGRRDLRADFHCVSGWTSRDLVWSGVAFADFWSRHVAPVLRPDADVSHLRFRGYDGVPATLLREDALASEVMLADRLDGDPLDGDHGAPVRLVSPAQYGYMSIKHLRTVELLDAAPPAPRLSLMDGLLIRRHPRARVADEERNGILPNVVVRPLYRLLRGPTLALCGRVTDG